MNELEKLKLNLDKAIAQGRKIETLTGMEEWQFFAGYLRATREEITNRVMQGQFLNNRREEDFNKGIAEAIRVILDSAEGFKNKAEKAKKEYKKIEEQENV